ncbi:GNAT family N-acetyltransferase [Paraconexibacter sp.]|uniref:GNAT family N-acetyltransferase n=1 Tax=Paraconexibacter sp. TaxID=2949640 RepID=UPI0035677291
MFAQLLGYRFSALRDGRRLLVRPIGPDDKALLAWGVSQLSRESSYLRFFASRSKLSAGELRYLTEVDHVDHEALVAVLADQPDVLVGVVRFVRQTDDPEAAEVAMTIADSYQGQGVGRHLLELAMDAARDRGVRRFVAIMLAENHGAQRLFGSAGDVVEVRRDGSEIRLVFDIGAARRHPRAEVPSLLAAA